MNISALCVSPNSIYKDLGLDCYDIKRDARSFNRNCPVIAHPPCRGWTRFGKAMNAKPRKGELGLAPFCLNILMKNGGVLEHPYESHFVHMIRLFPGIKRMLIDQDWFGHPCRKRTWLVMPEYYVIPEIEFRLIAQYNHNRTVIWHRLSKHGKSATPIDLAKWLIKLVEINNDF